MALLAAVAALGGAPARAAAGVVDSGHPGSPQVLAAGGPWVAYEPADGSLRLRDLVTGSVRDVAVPASCPMAAAGYGRVLLACENAMVDVARAAVVPVPGAHAEDELYAFGARWALGTAGGRDVLVDWHRGTRRVVARHRNVFELDGPGAYDLDAPGPTAARPCSTSYVQVRSGGAQVIVGAGGELVAQRCGQDPRAGRVIDRCAADPCRDVTFSGGVISWSVGDRLRAWARGRLVVDAVLPGAPVSAAHAAGALFAGVTLAGSTAYYQVTL